jgi:hypothetical protein
MRRNVQHIRWSGLSELIAGFLGSIVVQLPEPMVSSWLVALPEICEVTLHLISVYQAMTLAPLNLRELNAAAFQSRGNENSFTARVNSSNTNG